MKHVLIVCLLLVLPGALSAQESSIRKQHTITLASDTIRIDSLSIIPGSLTVVSLKADIIPDSLYRINYAAALFMPDARLQNQHDSLLISYKHFPLYFAGKYRYLEPQQNRIDPVRYNSLIREQASQTPFNPSASSLYTSGDLSRGIQVGNQQDASLNSSLNLQISGKINPQFTIEAQLSDANIPVQPEGNTAQIQEFDRLFIRIYNQETQIQAGDFTLGAPEGYFQRMNKNLKGIRIATTLAGKNSTQHHIQTQSTAAVVKGKFNRMQIKGSEGNQGPYLLTGSEGEQFIQVIAGSEQVFMDGVRLTRGENEDYTIDYNTAELRFTTKNLMTKDKRISVHFEYTDRNYARFILSTGNQWTGEKGKVWLNLFSESDAKNQPLLQELSNENKEFLSGIGDQTDLAVISSFYETPFVNDRVLYRKTDTLVNGIEYKNILVYNTHPDSTSYQAGFTYLGVNKGNYIPVQTNANGQVYEWVAPVDGAPRGTHEPASRLTTPKSKQIYTLGGETLLGKNMTLHGELSLTSNDLNTFSELDRQDNQGTGIMAGLTRFDLLRKDSSLILHSHLTFRRTGKQFSVLEPFREVEFERDWNLEAQLPDQTEHWIQTGLRLEGRDSLQAAWSFDYLNYQNRYSGNKQHTRGNLKAGKFRVMWTGSYMQSQDSLRQTGFLRHQLDLIRNVGPVSIKLSEQQEVNRWNLPGERNLMTGSFRFSEFSAEVGKRNPDVNPWFVKMKYRTDDLPDTDGFLRNFGAIEGSTGISLRGKKGRFTRISGNWRRLTSTGNFESSIAEENTSTLRIEEQFTALNGALASGSFFETGSGLERKQDYFYLEVPQGQGYYTWSDYNGNQIKELDEFEVAVFADQANYIRVFRPGNNYIPVYTNRFTQTLSLTPGRLLQSDESKLRFLRLFNNQFSWSSNRRNQRTGFIASLNPLYIEDSLIVSMQSQMNNRLSFTTQNGKLGIDYLLRKSFNQNLMSYGTEFRKNLSHSLIGRLQLFDLLWVNETLEKGVREYDSQFFMNRNYLIDYWLNNLLLTLETGDRTRVSIKWDLGEEKNLNGEESLFYQQAEIGGDYQFPGKGLIHLDIRYIYLSFVGNPDSPTAWSMLKGFRPGHNGTANLSIRRKINDLIQLDLNYGLRLSQNSSLIHTGNVTVRAIF